MMSQLRMDFDGKSRRPAGFASHQPKAWYAVVGHSASRLRCVRCNQIVFRVNKAAHTAICWPEVAAAREAMKATGKEAQIGA
ncbi:MAG: hypothetical protein GY803_08095 [Chloroflexi bacterium]|nr:hypothetical protein [Chloroflexota bacterium]